MPDINQKPVYVCGDYRVDVFRRRLFLGDEPLAVTAKAFDVLMELIKRAGEVVSKQELLDTVWADSIVEENNLTQQISALRKLFNERASDHRFIATVPGRGYCFVAPVGESAAAAHEVLIAGTATSSITIDLSRPDSRRSFRSLSLETASVRGFAIAAVYVIAVFLSVVVFSGRENPPKTQSVGVLTFRTLGIEDERYGVGIRDTLRAKLGSLDDITVRPGGDELPVSDTLAVGRRMNVDVVLAGSIQHEHGRVRVAVELVDIRGERVMWGRTFDGDAADLFLLQDSIASEVVETLRSPRPSRSSNHRSADHLAFISTVRPAFAV